jgi:hypothetical protein
VLVVLVVKHVAHEQHDRLVPEVLPPMRGAAGLRPDIANIERTGCERKCPMALESMRNRYRTSAKSRAVKAALDVGGRAGNAKP